MGILVTGAAGFIGFHVAQALLARGDHVVGLDNLNDYYDVALKQARLDVLSQNPNFTFVKADLAVPGGLGPVLDPLGPFQRVVHLAAQAGVRYSLENPFAYMNSNLHGHLAVLEYCRATPDFTHLVYASSSSVYGGNTDLPFSVEDRVDKPVSLYAATKRSCELLSHSYGHLYDIPQTGLRFFTVYGPWGRPDMALYIFTKAIMAGEPIEVFNNGKMARDFTFIDDVVHGTIAALDTPPTVGNGPPVRIYNIGNHQSEPLMKMIEVLEQAIGAKAEIKFAPMQPGDVAETYADITAAQQDLGFSPSTPITEGIPKFVDWFRQYHAG
ncbi:MAG: NAD-dependent epimerase/dehydratase family protein [Alphaproteobacteria bacterium]|jgi:UDP-glucuronate 4-epimerase|nr:NAD-dependent epimerase/dehydratase family protein [Alphaproteobacteria bacterium]MBT5859661.1 NAD-dependent epimerase/dehydratase family protein [Alphaproteobacteria bacterium]